MKISKHIHSCLLAEDQGKTILIDPGNYTFEEGGLDVKKLERLDAILITHEHLDHMCPPLIKKILEKFAEVKIYSNEAVKKVLAKDGINVLTSDGQKDVGRPEISGGSTSIGRLNLQALSAPHELVLGGKSFDNTVFNIFGKLTHPGDSLQFNKSCDILALPIQAPWGSFVASVEKAAALKPKVVIPIHDWHWKDSARKKLYDAARNYLAERGIDFRGLELGEELTID